jgi:gluconate 2-dehydrogenase gamma chain
MQYTTMNRRHFIKLVTLSGTSALAVEDLLGGSKSSGAALAPDCQVFTSEQAAAVEAMAEQFIPKDDFPGGKDAGVLYFIDKALADPLARLRPRYVDGLRLVSRVSQERYRSNFNSLSSEQQNTLLRAFESGEAAGVPGQEFLTLIRRHSMQGYYSDPTLGGNRNGESWKLLHFTG